MKVVMQGETSLVDSQKSENGKLAKCNIVLQEFGGKFENQFAAVMLGKDAQLRFYAGEVVVVKLRFQTHEYQRQVYQELRVQDIENMMKHEIRNNHGFWNITKRKEQGGASMHPRALPPGY